MNDLLDGHINPEILSWARKRKRISLEDAARRVNKQPESILAWEEGSAVPTVKQARKLAAFYGRPFLEFFRKDKPPVPELTHIADFRLSPNVPEPEKSQEFVELMEWVESVRVNALDLMSELERSPTPFPSQLGLRLEIDPEDAGLAIRRATDFTIDDQMSIATSRLDTLPGLLREHIEKIGVLVLRSPLLKQLEARGMCIAKHPLPVIVYTQESAGAQAFTLIHELAHICLSISGISGPLRRNSPKQEALRIERWCNKVAAAFLMPREALLQSLPTNARNLPEFPDEELANLARSFRVSDHAMLVRLVNLNVVDDGYYWNIKKPEFDQQEFNFKSFGRSAYWASRYPASLGSTYTGLVLDAWSNGKIGAHNAAEYFGISGKKQSHLNDIRDHVGR